MTLLRTKFRLMAGEESQQSAGGSATAAATETPANTTADPLESGAESVNWGSFADDNFNETSTVEGDIVVEQQTAKVETPVETKTETPATQAPATVPAQSTGTQPAETPAIQQPTQQAQQQTEEPQPSFDWDKWEADTTQQLASQYQLTDDEATAMLTEPETILPKMAASVHARVVKNVLQQLPAILPQIVQHTLETQKQTQSQQELFFGINADLADAKFANAIQQAGQVYRQLNPTADAATAAFAVGNMVRASLGLPLKTEISAAPGTQTTAAAPAQSAPAQQQRTQPFTPAQGGSGGAAPAVDSNPFSQLAEELLQSDM